MAPKPRVLVIDDDPLFRRLTAGLLKKHYAVRTAGDGAVGYELALDRPPHVALIDVQMNGGDGLATLKKFREDKKLSAVKTAVLAGDASRETVVAAIRTGADEYIVKSNVTREELLRKLRALVASSSIPVEEEPEIDSEPSSKPHAAKTSARPDPAMQAAGAVSNDDSRLQGMIDGWD